MARFFREALRPWRSWQFLIHAIALGGLVGRPGPNRGHLRLQGSIRQRARPPTCGSRVERCRGSLGGSMTVTGPFVCRCPTVCPMPRLHRPLVEPDVRISRIRLSDQALMPSPTRPGSHAAEAAAAPASHAGIGTNSVNASTPAPGACEPATDEPYAAGRLSPADRPS